MPTRPIDSPGPLSTLRGASVAVDSVRVTRAALALCFVTLCVVAVILFVAGADKNAQIETLRSSGVAVEVKVTGCMGLLGGSGSNAAGYACRGSYRYDGRRYEEAIPGNTLRAPGASVRAVIAPDDPGLISTAAALRTQRPSWRVYVVPGALALGALVAAGLLVRFRRGGGVTGGAASADRSDAEPAGQAGGV